MAGRPYKCPYCSSTKTIWKGYRQREDGKARLRRCRNCGRRFTSRIVVQRDCSREPGAGE